MRTLLGLIMLGVTVPASAADWQWLTVNASGGVIYYDASSIQRHGDRARIWIRVDHRRDRTTQYRETRELWSYDCRDRTTLALSAIDYLPNGRSVQRRQLADDPFDYTPVIPESVAEVAMRRACT
jgi:hypothetical protein